MRDNLFSGIERTEIFDKDFRHFRNTALHENTRERTDFTAFDGPVNHQTDIFGNLNPVLIQRQRNAAGEIIGINKQPLRTLLHFPECLHCGISELFHIHHRTISMNPVFRIFPLVPDAKPVFGGMMKQ